MDIQVPLPSEYIITWVIFFGGVGFMIHGGIGAFFGIFLGPIGLAIAAILKLKNSISSPYKDITREKDEASAIEKWNLLKSIDSEVSEAAIAVKNFCLHNGHNDNLVQKELAIRYFKLNEKKYLNELVEQITSEPWEKIIEGIKIKKASGKIAELKITEDNRYYYISEFTGEKKLFDSLEEAKKYFK